MNTSIPFLSIFTCFIIVGCESCSEPADNNIVPGKEEKLDTIATQDSSIESVSKENFQTVKYVDLAPYEEVSGEEKLNLIDQLGDEYDYLDVTDLDEDAFPYFHFFDLDNDGDLDCIFDGWSGGEPVCVRINLNVNGTFKQVKQEFQHLTNLGFEDNKLSKFSINDPGCCTAYITFDEDWEVETQKDSMRFNLVRRTAYISGTPPPQKEFPEPIKFTVNLEKYYLRLEPKIDTTDVWFDGQPFNDNIIAEYGNGATGTAIGQSIDSTGRIWWLVEMDDDYKPEVTEFYDIDDQPTILIGWMSSRFLTKVE